MSARVGLAVGAALLALLPAAAMAQTIHLEAENARPEGPTAAAVRPAATAEEGSRPMRTGYSGEGYVTGFVRPDDRLVFTFAAPAAGVYDLRIAYACDSRKGYTLDVNGLKMADIFTASAGFSVHEGGKVELDEGANTIAIGRGWGYFDIDYIELTPSAPVEPVARPSAGVNDVHASPAARALLARVDEAYGRGMLLGVYDDEDAQFVFDSTGFRPAIMGGDLLKYSPSFAARSGTKEKEVERLIARSGEGYAITLSWHWNSPLGLIDAMLPDSKGGPEVDARWYRGFYTEATRFDLAVAMADPGSKERAALLGDIDAIAVQLRRLEAAGVPVLWRPLHEAEGGWFWWGAKGPGPFVQLWRLLYDRLVNVDGIHNLVWVYTSGGDPAWYPGDRYVDVVGIDAYPEDLRDPQLALWEKLLGQFAGRKPLAISEYGGVPDVARMQRLGAEWAYAVSWSGKLGPRKNGAEDLRRIYGGDGALKMAVPAPAAAAPVAAPVVAR